MMKGAAHARSRGKRALTLLSIFILLSVSYAPSVLAVEESFEYDANGNLIQDGQFYYEYNGMNMLSRVREGGSSGRVLEEYWYDHSGRRQMKVQYLEGGGNITTYYVNKNFETVIDENGVREDFKYVWANGERVAKIYENGSKVYYLNDHLGSSSVLVDEEGNELERIQYYPFGAVKAGGVEKYGYNSKELDDTGLLYYGARYYNPQLRRWTQPDTLLPNVYDPQQLNRYSYARNNPLRYSDEEGNSIVDKVKMAVNPIVIGVNHVINYAGGTIATVGYLGHEYFEKGELPSFSDCISESKEFNKETGDLVSEHLPKEVKDQVETPVDTASHTGSVLCLLCIDEEWVNDMVTDVRTIVDYYSRTDDADRDPTTTQETPPEPPQDTELNDGGAVGQDSTSTASSQRQIIEPDEHVLTNPSKTNDEGDFRDLGSDALWVFGGVKEK